jgi:hypothetical protein
MAKLNVLVMHVLACVKAFGCWSAIGEQSFEHKEDVSRKSRDAQTRSKSAGAQIIEDLQWMWR